MYSQELIENFYKYIPKEKQNATHWWWEYLIYCKKNNINTKNQTYEEYVNTMEKVYTEAIKKIVDNDKQV